MKKIIITTPENIDIEYTLADIGSRVAAAFIDTLLQIVFYILLVIAMLLIHNFAPTFWYDYYGWLIGGALLIYAIISYGYFIIMELKMNGRTLGKKAMKLRTIRNNGQPITFKHSAIRNLVKIFLDLYGIGIVFIFLTKNHKRIGDFAASTIVVIEKTKAIPITLDSLEKANKNFDYYLTCEEQGLLQDYLIRKDDLEDPSTIKDELGLYLTNKFEKLGMLKEWESFIDQI
jgi:uncharacterized RDD family membrane protein YckC